MKQPTLTVQPKLRIEPEYTTVWPNHRSGWKSVVPYLKEKLHSPDGTPFYSFLDGVLGVYAIHHPFVGVLHHTPFVPHRFKVWSLSETFDSPWWIVNERNCKGLYTLSWYTKEFVQKFTKVPVEALWHPMQEEGVKEFDPDLYNANPKRLLFHIGHMQRREATFWKLDAPGYERMSFHNQLSNEGYDAVLQRSVVFLHLYDAAAVNTIMDCIARNTPIIVNRCPATEEYLGEKYPLLYDSLEQAEDFLSQPDLILHGHTFIKHGINKNRFTNYDFVQRITLGEIYKNLP